MSEKNVVYAGVVEASDGTILVRKIRNELAIRLLKEWAADESGYDEEVWPRVKAAIEANRLSERPRFDD